MPAANISKFINLKDKNGVCVGEWATQIGAGVVLCNVCIPKCQVKFVNGKKALTNHSESVKPYKNFVYKFIHKYQKTPAVLKNHFSFLF